MAAGYLGRQLASSAGELVVSLMSRSRGWAAIFVDLAKQIEQHRGANGTRLPEILQIKEKFGMLRVYIGKFDVELRVMNIRAEHRSALTCEICVAVGSLRSGGGWLRTRCEEHADHRVGEIV
jgi:hypothetical protein